jgi:hypothetical protein
MKPDRQLPELERRYDELYEQYGRPLERDHNGKYLAVSARGEIILGQSLLEVAQRATDEFGPGSFLFKVGDRAVGRWR